MRERSISIRIPKPATVYRPTLQELGEWELAAKRDAMRDVDLLALSAGKPTPEEMRHELLNRHRDDLRPLRGPLVTRGRLCQ